MDVNFIIQNIVSNYEKNIVLYWYLGMRFYNNEKYFLYWYLGVWIIKFGTKGMCK